MKTTLLLVGIGMLSGLSPRALAAAETESGAPLVLTVGEQRRLTLGEAHRYSIGDPGIVRASPDPHDRKLLILKAIKPGRTDLWIWQKDGSSRQHPLEAHRLRESSGESAGQIRALGRLLETEVFLTDREAVLRGELRSASEARRIADLLSAYPTFIRDETEPSAAYLESAEARLRERLAREKGSYRLEREGGRLRVEGAPKSQEHTRRLGLELRRILPSVELRLDASERQSPTLAFHVYLLELRKSRFQSLGVRWPSPLQAFLSVSSASGITGMSELEFALDALEGRGDAKILSRPQLAVRVPGEAELFSGGELPIQKKTRSQSEVSWKPFGLLLKLKAEGLRSENVRLEIQTEVSHLDNETSVAEIPGLRANRLRTQVEARLGKPLFLSGLLQSTHREQAQGIPGLREIPILGALFGSKDYREERSELVAVLLPLAEPVSALGPRPRVPKGPVPLARAWMDPSERARLESSDDYPWNALE